MARKRAKVPRDPGVLKRIIADDKTDYWGKIRAAKECIGALDSSDVIAMCAVEIAIAAEDLSKSGSRSNWARLLFDAIKWRDEREHAGQAIQVVITNAEDKGL